MKFDLSRQHLGDLLLLAPVLRDGDQVIIQQKHRLPQLPIEYIDFGEGVCRQQTAKHATDSWIRLTSRSPIRHELIEPQEKDLLVIAPDVVSISKKWHGFTELISHFPSAVVLDSSYNRQEWITVLNRAHTVVCPDTGTVHMADALGCPKTVGLYGKAFDIYAPYWNRQYCISKRSMNDITVQEVINKIHDQSNK